MAIEAQGPKESVERIQGFPVETLSRVDELGRAFSFDDAIPQVRETIDLFRRIPSDKLSELPQSWLKEIQQTSDRYYTVLEAIQKFDPKTENPHSERDALIDQARNYHQTAFEALWKPITYFSTLERDFARFERDAREKIARIEETTSELTGDLEASRSEAQGVLSEIKRIAAEQGVSQQAIYFKEEAEHYSKQATYWLAATVVTAAILLVYAAFMLFFYNSFVLPPTTTSATIQLVVSKILVFVVLAYAVTVCPRNFLSHRHNYVVNKHRQNVLMTFEALVKASGAPGAQDIVLTQAATCIFAPQDTGFSKPHGVEGISSVQPTINAC